MLYIQYALALTEMQMIFLLNRFVRSNFPNCNKQLN